MQQPIKMHIVYKEKEEDFFSKGVTIQGTNISEIVLSWMVNYPDTIFMAMYVIQP